MFPPRTSLLLLTTWLTVLDTYSAKQVDTIYGPVDGNTVTLDDGTVINSWYGIPYARPPVGNLRFEPPQPPAAWTEVFYATELASQCIQPVAGLLWFTHPGWSDFSEDCLNLNVFAPDNADRAPYPVMVWFHGGGYTAGGNIQYPGHFLAAKDVVVVVPNYRLGALGFLSSLDGTVRGNMGMFDQALALRWVRNNIGNFGGDPNKVTIFGESAGGASTMLHTVSPFSKGLFHKAIAQSGSTFSAWTISYPEQKAYNYLYQLANRTDCLLPTDRQIIACLRTVPAVVIMREQDVPCEPGQYCNIIWAPIVDGTNGFLPKLPSVLKDEQTPADTVPLIAGICSQDGALFTLGFVPEMLRGGFNSTMFDYYLRTRLIETWAPQLTDEETDDVFEAMRFNYAPWPYLDDLEANRQAFVKILTDIFFGYPFDWDLKVNAAKNPNTYGYVLSYISPNASFLLPEWTGVIHTADIPNVYGYPKLLKNPDVRNDSGIVFDIIGWVEEDINMADYVISLWTNFAKNNDPTFEPVKSPFDDTTVTWQKFSMDGGVKIIDINWQISMLQQYKQRDYAFYTDYMPYVVNRRPPTTEIDEIEDLPSSFDSARSWLYQILFRQL